MEKKESLCLPSWKSKAKKLINLKFSPHVPLQIHRYIYLIFLHPFHISRITLSLLQSTMALLSLCESDNKENVFPFSSKQPILVLALSHSSCASNKRRIRYPLADITNFFDSLVDSTSASHDSASPVSFQAERPKRRVHLDLDSMCKNSHLVYSSRNFR